MKQGIHITDSDGCSDCAGLWDNRPLTDKTLKELGFKKSSYCLEYPQPNPHIEIKGGGGFVFLRIDGLVLPYVKFKTAGSVKRLIEALKGDE